MQAWAEPSKGKRHDKKPPPSDGGGGGDGGDGGDDDNNPDDDDESDGEGDRRQTPARRGRQDGRAPASEPTGTRRKKEGEEVKLTPLPRNASEAQPWLDYTTDAVAACAIDAEAAFQKMVRVQDPNCTFEELAAVPADWQSMNMKVRGAVAKLLIGQAAEKTPELVSMLSKRRDELRRAATPRAPVQRKKVPKPKS